MNLSKEQKILKIKKRKKLVLIQWFYGLILFGFLMAFSNSAKSQIEAPVFLCVVNDTLVWDLPMNNCGPFNAYEIYFSLNENGPYQLLTTITNQNQTDFFHNNPTGETYYYFMQSDYDCPGEPVLSSDTLNNEAPEIAQITSVSVDGGNVIINWLPSSSPEVSNYIIYRTTPIGVLPIDTVAGIFTEYVDTGADPETKSESYYVIAIDACGNASIFDLPHFTIFMDIEVDPCERTISLDWNLYRNWQNGIERQEVWGSVNGNPPVVLDTLSSADSSYVFSNTNDGDSYCFFVKAIEANTGSFSSSNEQCLLLDVVEPVRELFIKKVSVNAANQVEITWIWNADAEVKAVNVFGVYEQSEESFTESFTPTFPLTNQSTQVLNEFDPTRDKVNFTMSTVDDCDDVFDSENDASTIFLSGTPNEDLTNTINWTPYDIEEGTILSYDIYRIVENDEIFLETVSPSVNTINDPVDNTNEAEAIVCYYVVANIEVLLPSGIEMTVQSRSNTLCVEQLSQIITPNAFAPEGINKEFKPIIVFGETAAYKMEIYNRWGQRIFETEDQDEGWTGQDGLTLHQSGVYVFLIKIQQASGRMVEEKGTVILIR